MLFTIKQLIDHVQSTSGLSGKRWIPVRPRQLSGIDGLKQRISHATRVLTGELDVIDWTPPPVPRELPAVLVKGETLKLEPGFKLTSFKINMVTRNDTTPLQTKTTVAWVKIPGTNPYWSSKVTTEHGEFTLSVDVDAGNVQLISGSIEGIWFTYIAE